MPREFKFDLSQPLTYGHGGELATSSFVILTAPTSRERKECAYLKQAFFVAINENRSGMDEEKVERARERLKQEQKKDEELLSGEEVMMMIASSTKVKFDEFLEVGRRLLQSGVAKIGGEEKLTGALIDKMDMDDFEKLVGDYLAFFTLQSSLTALKNI